MDGILSTILTVAEVLGALGVICGLLFALFRWILKQNKQDEEIEKIKSEDIKQLKEENTLICYGLSACLDGLEQLGANHTVPKVKSMLNKHLNVQAQK